MNEVYIYKPTVHVDNVASESYWLGNSCTKPKWSLSLFIARNHTASDLPQHVFFWSVVHLMEM